jgi:tryptophan synthase beta chain
MGVLARHGVRLLRHRVQSVDGAGELRPKTVLPCVDGHLIIGATVAASPSRETESGRAILAGHPNSTGSLGIAISEAVEVAANDPHSRYALGSVLNHVLLHQTVIGLEAIEPMVLAGDEPDVIVGCTGGRLEFRGPGAAVPRPKVEG